MARLLLQLAQLEFFRASTTPLYSLSLSQAASFSPCLCVYTLCVWEDAGPKKIYMWKAWLLMEIKGGRRWEKRRRKEEERRKMIREPEASKAKSKERKKRKRKKKKEVFWNEKRREKDGAWAKFALCAIIIHPVPIGVPGIAREGQIMIKGRRWGKFGEFCGPRWRVLLHGLVLHASFLPLYSMGWTYTPREERERWLQGCTRKSSSFSSS